MYGVGILSIAVIAHGILLAVFREDSTYSTMSFLFVWPAAIFSLLIWWTFFSGWSWTTRLVGLGLLAIATGTAASTLKVVSANGDMIPRFTFRWVPDAETESRTRWSQRAASKPPGKLPQAASETPATGEASETVVSIPTAAQPKKVLPVAPEDWPGFRGAARDGIVSHPPLRRDWGTNPPKPLWKQAIGRSWSSFAVVGDQVYTQEQRGDDECVVCYQLDSGKELWEHRDGVEFKAVLVQGGPGPRATPQYDQGRLYSVGGTGLLNCLDATTGKAYWSTNILADAGTDGKAIPNLEWGMSGSPLVVDDLVVVTPGAQGGSNRGVIAYNKLTGKVVWAQGSHQASYSSPRLETLHGVRQVLDFHADGLSGHRLEDGQELWSIKWTNPPKVNSAQPIALPDSSVIFGSGYAKGSARYSLQAAEKAPWESRELWATNRLKLKFNDAVFTAGHVFGLDEGVLTCLNPESGKAVWKYGRFGYGQLLLVNDLLLILSEAGTVTLVEANPKSATEVASFQALDESGVTWNHPALSRGRLLVRNALDAACYDLR